MVVQVIVLLRDGGDAFVAIALRHGQLLHPVLIYVQVSILDHWLMMHVHRLLCLLEGDVGRRGLTEVLLQIIHEFLVFFKWIFFLLLRLVGRQILILIRLMAIQEPISSHLIVFPLPLHLSLLTMPLLLHCISRIVLLFRRAKASEWRSRLLRRTTHILCLLITVAQRRRCHDWIGFGE